VPHFSAEGSPRTFGAPSPPIVIDKEPVVASNFVAESSHQCRPEDNGDYLTKDESGTKRGYVRR
jgi:hypothetical protein